MRPCADFSIAGQYSAGIFPRARQLLILDWLAPMARPIALTPPNHSIALSNPSMSSQYHERETIANANVIKLLRRLQDMDTIAKRIKETRVGLELTQKELAKKAGVSQGTIGNLESGARTSPRHLVQIANALGVTAEWLQSGVMVKAQTAETVDDAFTEFFVVYSGVNADGKKFLRNAIAAAKSAFMAQDRRTHSVDVAKNRRDKQA
jgi:transcriptional regulator with XRE-family HTH domain